MIIISIKNFRCSCNIFINIQVIFQPFSRKNIRGDIMNKNCAVATSVSALAEIIALKLSDEELELIAAILVQLGDTLATILTLRECGGKG